MSSVLFNIPWPFERRQVFSVGTHTCNTVTDTHILCTTHAYTILSLLIVSSEYIIVKQSLSSWKNVMSFLNRPKINYWKKLDLVNEASPITILVLGLVVKIITSYQIQVATRVVFFHPVLLFLVHVLWKTLPYEKQWKERNPIWNSCPRIIKGKGRSNNELLSLSYKEC